MFFAQLQIFERKLNTWSPKSCALNERGDICMVASKISCIYIALLLSSAVIADYSMR